MKRILLIDGDEDHAMALAERLKDRQLSVAPAATVRDAIGLLRGGSHYELVILDVSAQQDNWPEAIRSLQECGLLDRNGIRFSILCMSKVIKPAEFVLRLERLGCRYVLEG